MNDCNYKIFNNKRLMPKQEKRKEKEDETFDRSQYEILWTAKKAWENIEPYRRRRKRNRKYTFGQQWSDKVTLPDGRTITESNI